MPDLRQVTLSVTAANAPAIALYESMGFPRAAASSSQGALCGTGLSRQSEMVRLLAPR
ncbi:hypothetical protein ACU4GD_35660 [Cupriavidus basilensis]